MAERVGVDVLLYIQTGTDDTTGDPIMTFLAGQRNATLNRESESADLTAKKEGGGLVWGKGRPIRNNWSIEADGLIVPDDTAYAAIRTAWKNGDYLTSEVLYEDGSKEKGQCYIEEFPDEHPWDGESTFSVTLTGHGELTEVAAA